jgi:hypothetical protein
MQAIVGAERELFFHCVRAAVSLGIPTPSIAPRTEMSAQTSAVLFGLRSGRAGYSPLSSVLVYS